MPQCYECNEEVSRKDGKYGHGNIFICNFCAADTEEDVCPECGAESPQYIETGICPKCGHDDSSD
ncbi:MAG: hypothetical protein KC649_08050 [Candidatus Omnitrophica bacterium]|nr:hypothetical protein [Candidatus Omnitrophota bacterium]